MHATGHISAIMRVLNCDLDEFARCLYHQLRSGDASRRQEFYFPPFLTLFLLSVYSSPYVSISSNCLQFSPVIPVATGVSLYRNKLKFDSSLSFFFPPSHFNPAVRPPSCENTKSNCISHRWYVSSFAKLTIITTIRRLGT